MNKKQKIIAGFVAVVLLGLLAHWLWTRGEESTDDAMIEAHAIPIAAKVAGTLVSLNVTDNQAVKKGDVLAEVDTSEYKWRVDAAKAQLASAKANARNADIAAHRQLTIGNIAGTQKDIDSATAAQLAAQANVDNAVAQLGLAQKQLDDAVLTAPEDGTIAMRSAEQGGYVATGQQLFVLVGKDRWIVANFKERQLTQMKPGQKATIAIDAYPDLKLTAHVDSLQSGTGSRFAAFPPENATGNFVKIVQRVPVKLVFDDALPDNVDLAPGLSVVPTVTTK